MGRVLALVVRHGRTPLNAQGKLRAWEDPPLSREGELDAQMAANIVRQYKPKIVYSSDLLRDIATGDIIAELLGNLPREVDFGLRTANMGELSGQSEEATRPTVAKWYREMSWDAPSGESYMHFTRRMDRAFFPKLDLARDVESYRPSVFVAHGRNLGRLHSYYHMIPPGEADMPLPGGVALIRESDDGGPDQFEFVTKTEPILEDH